MPIFLKDNHQLESRMREIRQSGSEGGAKRTFVPTPILRTAQTREIMCETARGQVNLPVLFATIKQPFPPRLQRYSPLFHTPWACLRFAPLPCSIAKLIPRTIFWKLALDSTGAGPNQSCAFAA